MQSDSPTGTATGVMLVVLAGVAGLLYGIGLDRVPIHLHHDEIYFGLISDSVAHSLRDPQGRLLPVLFQMGDTGNWYPPILIYFTALWLQVVPLGDVAVRLPNAFIGVVDVVLMFFVARRLFQSRWLGLAAAAMLALTPAHFINSRIATDCLYPVGFILGWLLLLLRYLERPTTGRLLAAMALLGVGAYGYIASVVMMPIYVLMTLAIVWWERTPARSTAAALTGYALTFIPGVAFVVTHPAILGNYAAKYDLAAAGPQLNPFQLIREALTPWNISDHFNLFHSSFSPGYLFVTGGSNIAHSTRLAGVFLAPLAIFLIAGVVAIVRRPRPMTMVLLAGFLTAPLAATIVPEEFAVPRMLGLLPFGVLLATEGLQAVWEAPLVRSPRVLAAIAGIGLMGCGVIYLALMLVRQSHLSGSALLMAAIGAGIWGIGAACDERRGWKPLAALVLLLMPLQFTFFAADYFGDYRARSAGRYEFNIRGALEQAIALHDAGVDAPVFINDDILFVRGFWDYYLRVFKRRELLDRAIWFNSENGLPADVPAGSLVVTDVNEHAMRKLTADATLVQVAQATDPVAESNPPSERATFIIFRKR